MMPSRLKKGDTVIVIAGKDEGKKGKIIRVFPEEGRVVVERVMVVKRHQKRTQKFQGGIVEKPSPIWASNVMLVCPECGKPSLVGYRELEAKGHRVRWCKLCEKVMDRVK